MNTNPEVRDTIEPQSQAAVPVEQQFRDNRTRPRFVEMETPPAGERRRSGETKWWQDTRRPLPVEEAIECGYRFIAVECYADKDPNNYVPVFHFHILFTDQAEYYFVCSNCRCIYGGMQWSGSTRGGRNWRRKAEEECLIHQNTKGWCEFCDPVFGNGGWRLT